MNREGINFRIKPLEWKAERNGIQARTPFHTYRVFCNIQGQHWWRVVGSGIDPIPCASLEDGKAKCEADWIERISAALLPVQQSEYAGLLAVEKAARNLPRRTPAPGGASTEHDFKIAAAYVWENDLALKRLDDIRAALPSEGDTGGEMREIIKRLASDLESLGAPDQGLNYKGPEPGSTEYDRYSGKPYFTEPRPATLELYGARATRTLTLIKDSLALANSIRAILKSEEVGDV